MKLEVTELGPMKRALKIEIPEEDVNRKFTQAYAELNRQVRVPGFRPGKAPIALLEKRYAKSIEEDVVRSLVPDYYDRAVRQAGIVPILVEMPPVERIKIKQHSPFSFTATVEIKPTIELRDYKPPNPIALKPDTRTISDDMVDQAVETLRERQAQLHPAPADKTLSEGDLAIVDIQGSLDNTPLDGTNKEGHQHTMGSITQVLGLDIEEPLQGKKQGDSFNLSQPYPNSHPDDRLAGKTVEFQIKVVGVKEKKLPDLDDEFAKDCGHYSSLQELKDKLREEMEKSLAKDKEAQYKSFILKRLEETHHFDIPDTLIERELSSTIRSVQAQQQRKQGQSQEPPDPKQQQEEIKRLRDEHLPEATRRVKLGLILEAIATRESIQVEEEDIQAELEQLSKEIKISIEELQKLILAGGEESREELKGRILAEKAVDFVYRHAMIQG